MNRSHNWERRLDQAIREASTKKFAWGQFDCALFVCDCLMAITGVDPAAQYRKKYSDEAGAVAIYGTSLLSFVDKVTRSLSIASIPVTYARRGDVVFVDNGTAQGALAIVGLDGRFALCAGESGLARLKFARWKKAWRVR